MSTEDTVDKKATKKPAKAIKGFTDEERGAMRERVQELKADKADGESAVLAKISEMQAPDRALGERLHAIIKARRSARCRHRIAPSASGSMRLSKPARQPSRRSSGTGCPRMPRTARSSASSNPRTSSRRGTRRSASTTARTSTKAPCGRSPSR